MKKSLVKLTNGLIVGNFSSPHDFDFIDGSVLPACDEDYSRHLKVTFNEKVEWAAPIASIVSLSFELSPQVIAVVNEWCDMLSMSEVDYIICPLPMLTPLYEHFIKQDTHYLMNAFVSVRIADRIHKLSCIDKFCTIPPEQFNYVEQL